MEPLNAKDVTVLWHGWLKKLGRFSKRWRRRYFVFLSAPTGVKELRHYDAQKDVMQLLATTPKGVISMTDATGICCFLPPSPSAVAARKHNVFNLMDSHDTTASDIHDQKFAILTPLHVHLLAFQSGHEWANASESQQGLSLLACLSAFYPTVDVLHSAYMSKKRERTVHSTAKNSIISYWKRHFFVFLSSGDLLYFRDESLSELQGRVDVRHAPTVRVTGERMLEEHRKKEIGTMLLKFAKLPGGAANERENCLVWIATPPSKMFVLKLQDDSEGGTTDGRHHELTPSARKWLSLLLQGHAETKYTQLEQCVSTGRYEPTPEIVSAVRAGIPDELRGALWKGFSGASDLQRRAELKRANRSVPKTTSSKIMSFSRDTVAEPKSNAAATASFFDELSGPIDMNGLHEPENKMIFSRLCAVAMFEATQDESGSGTSMRRIRRDTSGGDASDTSAHASQRLDELEDGSSDSDMPSTNTTRGNSLKQVSKGKMGQYVYPSDAAAPEWELSARRRLLIAMSRFNPYSHPCPWKVSCLLLAYLDEDSAFWVINSLQDIYLPGYFHGYRPALQVDIAAFSHLLEERAPTLVAHLNALAFPISQVAERWFLSLFTATAVPLSTVLRIWDAFFAQGVRIFFGVGVALFLRAEEKLFRAKSAPEVHELLQASEEMSIDADALFSHAFKDDLNIAWLSEDRLDKVRARHRQRALDHVTLQLDLFKDKLNIVSQLQDQLTRLLSTVQRLLASVKRGRHRGPSVDGAAASPIAPSFRFGDAQYRYDASDDEDEDEEDAFTLESSLVTLQTTLKSTSSAVSNLSTDLKSRQSRWLALASQLAGCPLSRGVSRLTSDLQSWLSQVKEGKVSGAGLDAIPDGIQAVGGINVGFASALADQHELFFDVSVHGDMERSWLVAYKLSFSSDDRYVTELFMEALASTVKAACATRLECLAAANRFDWHSGRWLQFPVELTSLAAASRPRNLQRSASTIGKATPNSRQRNARSYAQEDTLSSPVMTTRTSLDDSVLQRRRANDTMMAQNFSSSHGLAPVQEKPVIPSVASPPRGLFSMGTSTAMYMQYADSSFYLASPPSSSASSTSLSSPVSFTQNWLGDRVDEQALTSENARALQQLSKQYRHGEQVLHSAVDSIMSCFSRFIRVDSRRKTSREWDLREHARKHEDDLVQVLSEMEAISLSAKQLV